MHQISKFILSWNSTCLGHLLCPSSGVICCTHGNWYVPDFQPDSVRKRSHKLHEMYQLPCVQQITPDDGHRRFPKHVEFHDKINFGYLMHLVGCFVRNIYSTPSQFNSSWVLTVYQVTVHNWYSKYPLPKSTHIWTRLITDCRTVLSVLGQLFFVW
jgi:hypothetical protein